MIADDWNGSDEQVSRDGKSQVNNKTRHRGADGKVALYSDRQVKCDCEWVELKDLALLGTL